MLRLIILSITLLSINWSIAQDATAIGVLNKANEAVVSNSALRYDYTYKGWGKTTGEFFGTVNLSKKQGMKLLVELNTLDAEGQIRNEELIYTDGNNLKLRDKSAKVLKVGTASGGAAYLMSYAWYAVFREFLMPDPFGMALKDPTLSYEGQKEVQGKKCHIIGTNNPWGDRNFWFIGVGDHQIYGQRQENNNKETEGGFTFEMANVQFNPELSSDHFTIDERGYDQVNEDNRKMAVGEQAPSWLLKNAAGKNISNKELTGKKYLLDFWASWCAPCWKIMPVIDRLKKENPDMTVYGVNVWESPKLDVNEYLKKKQLNHYQVLFDTEASVAKSFKIAALPLIVLVDENGKILYLNNGQDPKLYDSIKKLIQQ